ncbi:MCE family protein [[Mycobacterium] burgundiense]|uniref:MCE family protein n=1 Tax=[Mycobacterium] burgundiense TaxID=3064286 RepID=A0ABM9M5V7_9MYCO|nr:MCE family protein [Mycolicibacterium sp. MU0053]CAJ1510590.1 MCE family protein [Mycolicibacterium sp. MU0053]
MRTTRLLRRAFAVGCCALLPGCAFQGINSLPLPGVVGRGADGVVYHVLLANVGTLEPNSPVLIDDVVVGSVRSMRLNHWQAHVEISVRSDVAVPGNAVATVGQTSLLGSMHVALDAPLGEPVGGRLEPGATIAPDRSRAYPSTEQTLASLSTVVNAGGLGQIGDIVHNFGAALSGSQSQARNLLARLDRFVGVFDQQRDNVIASIAAMNRLAATLASQRDIVSAALERIPPALAVLNRERTRFTTALDKLRIFADTARGLIDDAGADLVRNLRNLVPTVAALADVGPDIDDAIAFAPVYPLGQNLIDRGIRGDYMNLFVTIDLTQHRLKKGLAAGTRWGNSDLPLVPAPGDPGYNAFYGGNPVTAPIAESPNGPPPPAVDPPPTGLPPGTG